MTTGAEDAVLRIVVAPDKFRGSLTAAEAAHALADGVLEAFPDAQVITFPMADGGEGTHDVAIRAGLRDRTTTVTGPLGDSLEAHWAIEGELAVVSAANASGLDLVRPTSESSRRASSIGTGQLIRAAMDQGATEILVGLGGSASTDGGSGALTALGLRLFDRHGDLLLPGGAALQQLHRIDSRSLDPRLEWTRIRLACDVTNPLTGALGSAAIFGPQKGADLVAVDHLEAGLGVWADAVQETFGVDVRNIPGGGAAGGLAAGLIGAAGATVEEGSTVLAELLGLDAALTGASLVLVGEGMLDSQSLAGKSPVGVGRAAKRLGVPAVAIAGKITASRFELAAHGIVAAYEIRQRAASTDDSFSRAAHHLSFLAAEAVRDHVSGGAAAGLVHPEHGTIN
jgi:glycerate kinase